MLRPNPAEADYPPNFAPGSIIRFTATPPDRDRIDVHTFRYLDAILNRAAAEGISRNSPCPCGSGRKYKHCHGVM